MAFDEMGPGNMRMRMTTKEWDELLENIANDRVPRQLDVSDQTLTPEELTALAEALLKNTNVTALDLSDNRVGVEIERFSELLARRKDITELNLRSTDMGLASVQNNLKNGIPGLAKILATNKSLRVLDLSNNFLNDVNWMEDLSHLLKLETLAHLKLKENTFDLSHALKLNSTLQSLKLRRNNLRSAGLKSLCDALWENVALTDLDLSFNRIEAQGAQYLSSLLQANSGLRILHLEHNYLKDLGAEWIAKGLVKNQALTLIDLDGNRIGEQGIQFLSSALRYNRSLEILSVAGNVLSVLGVRYLAEMAMHNQRIHFLVLRVGDSTNDVQSSKVLPLSYLLTSNLALKCLDLEYSTFGSKNFQTFSKSLDMNHTLRELNLSRTQLGVYPLGQFAQALVSNTTLSGLNLSHNHLDNFWFFDNGVMVVLEALVRNTALTRLDLSYNTMDDASAYSLARLILQHPALTDLNLSCNRIDAKGIGRLSESLKQSCVLAHLDVRQNPIEAQGVEYLCEALKKNTSLLSLKLSHVPVNKEQHIIGEPLYKDMFPALWEEALKENDVLSVLQVRTLKLKGVQTKVLTPATKEKLKRNAERQRIAFLQNMKGLEKQETGQKESILHGFNCLKEEQNSISTKEPIEQFVEKQETEQKEPMLHGFNSLKEKQNSKITKEPLKEFFESPLFDENIVKEIFKFG